MGYLRIISNPQDESPESHELQLFAGAGSPLFFELFLKTFLLILGHKNTLNSERNLFFELVQGDLKFYK